jgi:hypothetical protein
MLLVLVLAVQLAIWFHAGNIAAAAAGQGAAAGARFGASPTAAVATAQQSVRGLGGRVVGRPSATVTDQTVSVAVSVSVARLVPFVPTAVRRTATEPRERFVREVDR